jgi:hypothetical protein
MNTITRRFILRLIIGLLTFAIGVGAAMLLGGFRPFDRFSGLPHFSHRDYYYYQSRETTLEPAFEYHEYHERGCRMRNRLSELPPNAPHVLLPSDPHVDAPMPPPPPRPLR